MGFINNWSKTDQQIQNQHTTRSSVLEEGIEGKVKTSCAKTK